MPDQTDWKEAYDEEHARLLDMQSRFDTEHKRIGALVHNIGVAQRFAEIAMETAKERERIAAVAEIEHKEKSIEFQNAVERLMKLMGEKKRDATPSPLPKISRYRAFFGWLAKLW